MTSQSSKKMLKYVLITLIIAVIAFLCYTFFMYDKIARESEQHNFHYTIGISYTSTIDNVTILLPVPMLNGTTLLAESFLNREVHCIPPDWNLSVEMVNATPMLAIRRLPQRPCLWALTLVASTFRGACPATPRSDGGSKGSAITLRSRGSKP